MSRQRDDSESRSRVQDHSQGRRDGKQLARMDFVMFNLANILATVNGSLTDFAVLVTIPNSILPLSVAIALSVVCFAAIVLAVWTERRRRH